MGLKNSPTGGVKTPEKAIIPTTPADTEVIAQLRQKVRSFQKKLLEANSKQQKEFITFY